jgi:hypothetical protein
MCGRVWTERNVSTGESPVLVSFCGVDAGRAEARVYNGAGELVRELWRGTVQPNVIQTVSWDLLTDGGAAAASGVYVVVVRLEGGRKLWTKVGVVR